jgi:hypothetical protein
MTEITTHDNSNIVENLIEKLEVAYKSHGTKLEWFNTACKDILVELFKLYQENCEDPNKTTTCKESRLIENMTGMNVNLQQL